MRKSQRRWHRRSVQQPFGPITRPMCAASRSGARPETLVGLSGLGDLILTCSSPQSRNFSLGIGLGERRTPAEARGEKLAEGVFTAPILVAIAKQQNVDMPIANAVAAVLDGSLSVDEAIDSLLTRPFRAEG